MISNIYIFFQNENVIVFIISALFIFAVLYQTFSLLYTNLGSNENVARNVIIQFSFGLMFTLLLSLLNVIFPPWTFYNKTIIFKTDCKDLPGCLEKNGVYYIPKVSIQFAKESEFYKLFYKCQNLKTLKKQEINVVYNRNLIFGWEDLND